MPDISNDVLEDIRRKLKEANEKLKNDADAGSLTQEEAGDVVSLEEENEENSKELVFDEDEEYDEVVLEEQTPEKLNLEMQENMNKVRDDIISGTNSEQGSQVLNEEFEEHKNEEFEEQNEDEYYNNDEHQEEESEENNKNRQNEEEYEDLEDFDDFEQNFKSQHSEEQNSKIQNFEPQLKTQSKTSDFNQNNDDDQEVENEEDYEDELFDEDELESLEMQENDENEEDFEDEEIIKSQEKPEDFTTKNESFTTEEKPKQNISFEEDVIGHKKGIPYFYEESLKSNTEVLEKIPNYTKHELLEDVSTTVLTDKISNILEEKLKELLEVQKKELQTPSKTLEASILEAVPQIVEKWIDKNQNLILNKFEQIAEKQIAEALMKLKNKL